MKKKTILMLISGGVLIVAIVAILVHSPVIFQRGNPIPYLSAASKLGDETPYAQVNVSDAASVYISHKGNCDELLDYVSERNGVELQEQAGSAYVFTNGIDELVVTSEIYLGKYTVWEVPNETFFDDQSLRTDKVDYPPMVMFNDTLYSATNYEVKNETLDIVGEIESYIDYGIPTENNQANDNLIGCKIYAASSIPDYIFVLYEGIYSPYKVETERVEFHGKLFDKADLSKETLEWLERYNALSSEEQLAISYVPYELYSYENTDSEANADNYILFHGKEFNKADLSAETLEWLDWYNTLTPEEQLSISYVPHELYSYDSSGAAETIADE